MSMDVPPSRANSSEWGNTIAHEVFHYWNGSLSGPDHFVFLGRSLFITTPQSGAASVTFSLPQGWQPVVGSIEFVPPGRAASVSTDLVFEGCTFESSLDHHMRIYARRIEFLGCKSTGTYYACFASDDVPDNGSRANRFKLEDFLFYRCRFRVDGHDSACVRLHDITRLVIKDSVVATGGRHGLRIHGKSSYLFIRNLRCEESDAPGNGVHLGTIGGGTIAADRANMARLWLLDITSRVTFNEDINAERDGSVRHLVADNVWSIRPAGSFSSWEEITSTPLPAGWTITRSGRFDAD
jgi:hypothetical protein